MGETELEEFLHNFTGTCETNRALIGSQELILQCNGGHKLAMTSPTKSLFRLFGFG